MSRRPKPTILKLENPVQHYAWGSTSAIARLQGRPAPSPQPEAELWIGDHPHAPSSVLGPDGDGSERLPLSRWLGRDPDRTLGTPPRVNGNKLPFLTKVLAAARPLSLQVHPDSEQARAGYAREEAADTPTDRRCYRDAREKHELLIALSPFQALCGLRPDREIAPLVADTGSALLQSLLDAVKEHTEPGFTAGHLLDRLQRLDADSRRRLCDELSGGGQEPPEPAGRNERDWIRSLCAEHPGDPLVAAPVLMNRVALEPGEALVVAPGTLHAYLEGVGVEVMTPSDNVIRAGLSSKHIDLDEFRRVASTHAERIRPRRPETSPDGIWASYATGSPHFTVSVLALGGEHRTRVMRTDDALSVLLCVEGVAEARADDSTSIALCCGDALVVPAATDRYTIATDSTARVFVIGARNRG